MSLEGLNKALKVFSNYCLDSRDDYFIDSGDYLIEVFLDDVPSLEDQETLEALGWKSQGTGRTWVYPNQ